MHGTPAYQMSAAVHACSHLVTCCTVAVAAAAAAEHKYGPDLVYHHMYHQHSRFFILDPDALINFKL